MNLDFNTPCKAVKFDRWDLQENQVHACLAETDKLGHAFTRVDWLCMIRSSQPTQQPHINHAQRIWRRFLDPNGLLEQLTMGGSRANLVGGTDYQFDIYRLPFLSSERGVGSSTAQTVYRRSVQVTRVYGRKSSRQTPKRCRACRSLDHSFLEDTLIAENGTLILLSK